jgi:dihydrofolate synthase/folylpolyglutamate synthase
MNYKETIDYMFSQLPMYQREGKAAYKANLDNTIALCNHLNNPQDNFKSIHIAGTNGKGSTAHLIASILQTAGFKTALYTSPHLKDFRERIKINGDIIPKERVVKFVNTNKKAFEKIKPSFFEMTVGLAFQYFNDEKVDIAVIETGMGGRLDSTNIITPILSVITNIGYDHTQFLGDTISKIAAEKAEIIKKNIPVIIGETQSETKEIFIQKAKSENSQIIFADQIFEAKLLSNTNQGAEFDIWKNAENYMENLECSLLGNYQSKNLVTVIQVMNTLANQFGIGKKIIIEGIEDVITNTGLKGRWQIISTNPMTICDIAHNKNGIINVVEQIRKTHYNKLHFILGIVDDKNITDILNLLPHEAIYYFCKANIPRSLNEEILQEAGHKAGLNGKSYSSVREAYNVAVNNADSNDLVFVGGSTFVVAEIV